MTLPNLTDFEAHLTGGGDDVEKDDILDAAIGIVENIVGPLQVATVTETHRRICSDVLILRQMPVVALSSISSRYGATRTALTLGDYELDAETGMVRIGSGLHFYGDFEVTYSVGRDEIPVAIREAILIVAQHLYQTQRVPGANFGRVPGFGGSEADAPSATPGLGFALPNRAKELLEPYALGPVVA